MHEPYLNPACIILYDRWAACRWWSVRSCCDKVRCMLKLEPSPQTDVILNVAAIVHTHSLDHTYTQSCKQVKFWESYSECKCSFVTMSIIPILSYRIVRNFRDSWLNAKSWKFFPEKISSWKWIKRLYLATRDRESTRFVVETSSRLRKYTIKLDLGPTNSRFSSLHATTDISCVAPHRTNTLHGLSHDALHHCLSSNSSKTARES